MHAVRQTTGKAWVKGQLAGFGRRMPVPGERERKGGVGARTELGAEGERGDMANVLWQGEVGVGITRCSSGFLRVSFHASRRQGQARAGVNG